MLIFLISGMFGMSMCAVLVTGSDCIDFGVHVGCPSTAAAIPCSCFASQHEMSHLGFELRSASVPEDIAKRYAGFLLFEHMDGGLIFAMRVRVIRPEEHTQRVRAQAKLHELFKRFPPWPDLANMSQVISCCTV